MLRKIEYLIPAALKAIDNHLQSENPNGIPEGYQGAASGFGTTLMQMGLMPTIAVYSDKDSKADIDRKLLLSVLISIVKADDKFQEDKGPLSDVNGLLRAIIEKPENWKSEFKEHLLRASLAFKLALRTYHLVKN